MPFGETQAIVEQLAAARVRMTGANTAREPYYLVNSAADFSSVKHGWLVVNTTTGKATYAIKPVAPSGGQYTKILLMDDIFTDTAAGENYEVLRYSFLQLRPPYGLEPQINVIRWAHTQIAVDPTIYGVELWANNNLTPPALLEKVTRRMVYNNSGTLTEQHRTNAEGLIMYAIPVPPVYHAAIEVRNYSKRAETIYLAGFNKSLPYVSQSSESGG